MKTIILSFVVLAALLVEYPAVAQFKNIKLAEVTDSQGQPSGVTIALDRRKRNTLIAEVGPGHTLLSKDGGKTWNELALPALSGLGGFPSVVTDAHGNFYYFQLSRPESSGGSTGFNQVLAVSTASGTEGEMLWGKPGNVIDNPQSEIGLPGIVAPADQGGLYITWTAYKQVSGDSTCRANILFSHSGHGKKWSDPEVINATPGDCFRNGLSPGGSMAGISSDGRLFVLWADKEGLFLDRSYNDGKTWLSTDIRIGQQKGGYLQAIPGIGKYPATPALLVDNSDSFFRGSLYVMYADQSKGEYDSDIMLIRSTNRGDMWTTPQRVNQDSPGKQQFMPVITIDQATGVIYMLYYDRRAYDDLRTDVYLAYSLDGTNHFREVKISESPFIPAPGKRAGDYIGISAHKGVIAAIWTRFDDGQPGVWTTVIQQEQLFKPEELPRLQKLRK